jgi:hypothetical protein
VFVKFLLGSSNVVVFWIAVSDALSCAAVRTPSSLHLITAPFASAGEVTRGHP